MGVLLSIAKVETGPRLILLDRLFFEFCKQLFSHRNTDNVNCMSFVIVFNQCTFIKENKFSFSLINDQLSAIDHQVNLQRIQKIKTCS